MPTKLSTLRDYKYQPDSRVDDAPLYSVCFRLLTALHTVDYVTRSLPTQSLQYIEVESLFEEEEEKEEEEEGRTTNVRRTDVAKQRIYVS